MTQIGGFIGDGLVAVRDTLDEAVARANLHLMPVTVTKTMARRVRATLKVLETILRRLLVLLAAEVALEPVRKSAPRDRRHARARGPRGFTLLPVMGGDLSRLEGVSRFRPEPAWNRTETGTLLDRISRLRQLIENPAPAARRMARLLERLKRKGAPRPVALPQGGLHRHGHELALIAGILPQLTGEALAGWYDTS